MRVSTEQGDRRVCMLIEGSSLPANQRLPPLRQWASRPWPHHHRALRQLNLLGSLGDQASRYSPPPLVGEEVGVVAEEGMARVAGVERQGPWARTETYCQWAQESSRQATMTR